VPDQTQPQATDGGGGETPKLLTNADVQDIVDAKLATLTSKYNGEFAKLRQALKGETPAAPEVSAKSVTHDDLAAVRELGRLEAQVGDEVIASLGEDYSSASVLEQARILRMVAKISRPKTETVEVVKSRGETPAINTRSPRGEAPRPRDGVPRPTTKLEYQRMSAIERAELAKDFTFDPSTLPFR
jgi:hypothetical protein